jgi:hypothetical protein
MCSVGFVYHRPWPSRIASFSFDAKDFAWDEIAVFQSTAERA